MKNYLLMLLALVALFAVGCTPTEQVETEGVTKEEASETNLDTSSYKTYEIVGIEGVKEALEKDTALVVDARPIAGFNGWKLGQEVRGGHIAGATAFDATWVTQFESADALIAELNKFGITKDKEIVLYGYGEDAIILANALSGLGYEKLGLYKNGIVEWAGDASLEMSKLEHHEYLVPASWVNDLLAGKEVEGFEGGAYKIFEVSWGPGDTYAEGHIPTASHINTDDYEVGPLWNRVSDEEILKATLANGIKKDTTVILYGPDTTPPARVALMLKYLGVEDVRLLDGGYQAWTSAGYDVATGMVDKLAVTDFGTDGHPLNKDYIIDMPQAYALLKDENGRLVSIRSWAEYLGETSGYDYIEAAGRIEGAVYGFAGSDPWHMEDYRNVDNTAINYEYMAARWAEQTVLPTTENAFYCGTGWRASETWFYAHAMGWKNISLYDGGWKEWSESNMPMTKGEPVK